MMIAGKIHGKMGRCANPAESCSPADAAPLAGEREIGAREPESRTLGSAIAVTAVLNGGSSGGGGAS